MEHHISADVASFYSGQEKRDRWAMSGKLPMPPSTNDDPAGSASPRFALHGVIGIHLINEHRHYRAPIQEYNLQGSAA
jgi:hypothetical protein